MSTGYSSATPSRYVFNPARVYFGTGGSLLQLATRGGVTATETKRVIVPQVDGIPDEQEVEGNAYPDYHGLTLSFATPEFSPALMNILNDNAAGVATAGVTTWTPRQPFTLLPQAAYISNVRILGDQQGTIPTFLGYDVPLARVVSGQIQYAATGEATCLIELKAIVPAGQNPRTHIPFRRINRENLTL